MTQDHGSAGTPPGSARGINILPVSGLPEVRPGDDLGALTAAALAAQNLALADDDVVVVAQKAVSKAEGRLVRLDGIVPSPFAAAAAERCGKDPREVEVILRESRRMVRMVPGVLITETHHGHVCANAGIDRSNVADGELCLLPVDPDASARRLRERLRELTGADVAVIIADTFGRPWRLGQTNVAIGVAGMLPVLDYRGRYDAFGYELRVTQIATADELAGAAELVMGKTAGVPVALVRGAAIARGDGRAADLVRPTEVDLFK